MAERRHIDKFYAFGVVDRNNVPHISEACVCEDREPMDDLAENLNDDLYADDDPRRPYRVVRLVIEEVGRRGR